MADLLLELFSEEIPARMQTEAIAHLSAALEKSLSTNIAAAYSTPRRLAVVITDLPTTQPDISTELKGPKIDAPEAALAGFLKKSGLTKEQLEVRDGVFFAHLHQKGRPTIEVLKNAIEGILAAFPWPKSMRWGSGETSWVRPLHSILCLFDGKIVPIEFAGIKSGNSTRGHRFMAPGEIIVSDVKQYESALEKAFVIASREKRKEIIVEQSANIAKTLGLQPIQDAALLEEVVGLVEFPVVLLGKIDDAFMDLPPEVLTMVMRAHQKYFALQNTELEKRGNEELENKKNIPQFLNSSIPFISPYFLITSNLQAEDGGKSIIEGNQRVLRARFADARFFWDSDRKKPLSEFADGLKNVTYHAKLGTIADKVARIKDLALLIAKHEPRITNHESLIRAATLCKADLMSGMVGEFAELQGIMGRYYALQQSEPPEVADAIRDHYKPQGPSDAVPTAPLSVAVALADKLDTLICMFAIGEKPTGSKDPFALRRAALGVIRIVLENNLRLPLKTLFAGAPLKDIALHKAQEKLAKKTEAHLQQPEKIGKYLSVSETACEDIPENAVSELTGALLEFFHDRLIVQLKESGIRHDVIRAVIASEDDDLVRIVARAKALQEFITTEDGKNLLAGYKRAANILAIEEKKDKTTYHQAVEQAALQEAEEKTLFGILQQLDQPLLELHTQENFPQAMKLLAGLRAPVDQFFEKIMVNAEDKHLRINRLRLLSSIRDCMDNIADFALIEG